MATINKKNIDDFPSNTGPVRISKWKKKVVISSKSSLEQERTPARRTISIKFSLLRQFFSPARAFIAIGFANSSGRATDHAMKVNFRTAFQGSYPDIELDYSALLLSEGPLPLPERFSVHLSETNCIDLSWNSTKTDDGNDLLMVLIFNPSNRNAIVYTEAARRSDLKVSLPYDPIWNNQECLLYVAFHNADNTLASKSLFLGKYLLFYSCSIDFDKTKLYTPRKNKPYKKKDPKDFNVSGISGKVGPVIFFTNPEGEVIVRAKPKKRIKPQSQAEMQAAMRFKLVSKFLYRMHDFVKIGFAAHADHTLPHAAAMKANLKTIVSGQYPDYQIDYSKAQLSNGPLSPPVIENVQLDFPSTTISWKNTPDNNTTSSPADRLLIAILNPDEEKPITILSSQTRKDGSTTIGLPESWSQSQSLHLFLAFISASPISASPTAHLAIPQ